MKLKGLENFYISLIFIHDEKPIQMFNVTLDSVGDVLNSNVHEFFIVKVIVKAA